MSELLSGIGNLTKSLTSNISTYEIRKLSEKVQGMVMNYTESEQLVRDATNEDPWGPTGPQMKEISHLTFQYDNFHQVMNILWKRMFEDNKYAWRRVYKSLMLLNHLLAHGSERVIGSARDHMFQMRSLEHYKFTDEKGRDQGINIRHRAKLILELLGDEEMLRAERKKAKNDDKSKFQGFSAEDMRMGRGGSYNKDREDSYNPRKSSFEDEPRDVAREVNSFSFPAERDTNSPELGFRDERSGARNDDDDFGDFASARTSSSATQAQTANVPRISGPASGVSPKMVAAPPVQNNSFDLLGLDMDAPPSNPSITSPSALPRPPSGGPSPIASSNLVDDLFAAAPIAQPVSNSNNLFDADWSSAPTTIHNASAPSNDFADFSAYSSIAPAPTSASTPMSPMNGNVDLFAMNVSSPPLSSAPLQPLTPSLGFDFTSPSTAPTTSSKPTPVVTPSKVGSTWADCGLINLDNLASKGGPQKANVPMNQMKPNQNANLPW